MFAKKSILTFLTSVLLVSCGKNYTPDNNNEKIINSSIVGGQKVQRGFESVIALTNANGEIFCSGNLVSKNQITTASHCIFSTQVSAMEAQMFYMSIQFKVNQLLDEKVRNGEMSQEEVNSKVKDTKFIKPFVVKSIRLFMEEKVLAYGIHFGNGAEGKKVSKTRMNIIKKAIIPNSYVKTIFATFFGGSALFDPKTDKLEETITPDQALIVLNEEITDYRPIPFVSNEKARQLIKENKTQIQIVGFGQKADHRSSTGTKGMISFLKANLNKEGLTKDQKEQLQNNINNLNRELDKVNGLIEKSGDKYTTKIKVKKFDSYMTAGNYTEPEAPAQESSQRETENLSPKEIEEKVKKDILEYATNNEMNVDTMEELTGACFGDSGGPAFIQKENGEYVQVGVIVAVNFCGKDTFITPINF